MSEDYESTAGQQEVLPAVPNETLVAKVSLTLIQEGGDVSLPQMAKDLKKGKIIL